jgi:glycosyltransferase involved in cell wall biosynthesis
VSNQRSVRVLIDGWFLTGETRGIARYIGALVNALRERDDVIPIVLTRGGSDLARTTSPIMKPIDFRGPYPIWEQIIVPLAASRVGAEVIHSPANTFPLVSRIPKVVTLHDLIFMNNAWLSMANAKVRLRARYRSWVVTGGLRGVSRVVCLTAAGADEVLRRLDVERDRLRVVANAPDPRLLETDPVSTPMDAPFVLAIAAPDQRKNFDATLKAFEWVQSQAPKRECWLVVVGASRETAARVEGIGPAKARVKLFGFVSDAVLVSLYRGARCLVYPSRLEGFGLPIIEAQSLGTPVIAADAEVQREVTGGSAVLVAPDDYKALGSEILRLIASDEHHAHLAESSLLNARRFNWDQLVERIVGIYREAAKERVIN